MRGTKKVWKRREPPLLPFGHSFLKIDNPAVHDKGAVASGMESSFFLALRVVPSLYAFEDEYIILVCEPRVDDAALDVGKAFLDEGSFDFLRGKGSEAENGKLVRVFAGAVADVDCFLNDIDGRDGDDAFFGFAKRLEAVIGVTYHAGDDGREVHVHVPAHSHDVRLAFMRGREEDHRPRLDELEGLVEGKASHMFEVNDQNRFLLDMLNIIIFGVSGQKRKFLEISKRIFCAVDRRQKIKKISYDISKKQKAPFFVSSPGMQNGGYAGEGKVCSQAAVKALRTIRRCAMTVFGFAMFGEVFIIRLWISDLGRIYAIRPVLQI